MVGPHTGIVPLEYVANSDRRKGGKYLDTKGRLGIYDGTRLKCEHDRHWSECKECGGTSICEHGRRRSVYKNCTLIKRSKGVHLVAYPDPVFITGAFVDASDV